MNANSEGHYEPYRDTAGEVGMGEAFGIQADRDELTREIEAALAQLRLEYRSVFVLFHQQGLPYENIAQALKKPVGTIKTWLHRARLEVLDRLRRRGMVATEEQPGETNPAPPLTWIPEP